MVELWKTFPVTGSWSFDIRVLSSVNFVSWSSQLHFMLEPKLNTVHYYLQFDKQIFTWHMNRQRRKHNRSHWYLSLRANMYNFVNHDLSTSFKVILRYFLLHAANNLPKTRYWIRCTVEQNWLLTLCTFLNCKISFLLKFKNLPELTKKW